MNTTIKEAYSIKTTKITFGDLEVKQFRVIENKHKSAVSKIYTTKKSAENFIKRLESGDTSLMNDYLNLNR